jgi:transmembrane sensor
MDHQHQHNSIIKSLLRRYLRGDVTQAEKEQVEHWYNTLEDKGSQLPDNTEQTEQIRKSILHNITAQTAPATILRKLNFRYAAAAVICLLVSIGSLLYFQHTGHPAATLLQTGIGTTKRTVLPDGSIVTMNAGSTLLIPANYGQKERKVTLTGEAFFDIKPDPAHPFLVHNGKMTTTVLGTSFNIRAYPDQETLKISVVSGSVRVIIATTSSRNFILQHNETLQYQPVSGEISQKKEDNAQIGQWQSQVLDFNGYTIADMVATLQRQYPVAIQLHATPADTTHYNISFRKESLDNVLEVLSSLTGMTYQAGKGKLIIHTKTYAEQMK